jgi:hypothetical protein
MPFVLSVMWSLGCDFAIKGALKIYLKDRQQSIMVQMEQTQELEMGTKLKLNTCGTLDIANPNILLLIHLHITKIICMFGGPIGNGTTTK